MQFYSKEAGHSRLQNYEPLRFYIILQYSSLTMLCNFRCTAVIQLLYLFFFKLFSHSSYYRILSRVPCAIQGLTVSTLNNSGYMLIPDSQSIPPGNHKFFFQVCESVCFVNTFYSVSVKGTQSKDTEVTQSCLTLCSPVDCRPPGSSVHGISQARILEWVAISFSRQSFRPRDQTRVSLIAGRCFNLWATREAQSKDKLEHSRAVLEIWNHYLQDGYIALQAYGWELMIS